MESAGIAMKYPANVYYLSYENDEDGHWVHLCVVFDAEKAGLLERNLSHMKIKILAVPSTPPPRGA